MRIVELTRKLRGHVLEVVAGTGLVIVVAITIFNVINRYVLRGSAIWAPELAGMVYAWVVFIGAAVALRRGLHISISVLVRQCSSPWQERMSLFCDLLLAALFAYSTYLSTKLTIVAYSRISPAMHVPFSYVSASAVVGFAVMFVEQTARLARRWRRRRDTRPGIAA